MLNGFMIFLTATGWPVNWSRAELSGSRSGQLWDISRARRDEASRARFTTYQTSPKAPMPTGCKSVYLEIANVSNRVWGVQTLNPRIMRTGL